MATVQLLPGEQIVATGALVTVTNYRVIRNAAGGGNSRYVSITHDAISSCGLVTVSQPWLLVAAAVLVIAGLTQHGDLQTIGIVGGAVLIVAYLLTRAAALAIHSRGGESIRLPAPPSRRAELRTLLDAIDDASVRSREARASAGSRPAELPPPPSSPELPPPSVAPPPSAELPPPTAAPSPPPSAPVPATASAPAAALVVPSSGSASPRDADLAAAPGDAWRSRRPAMIAAAAVGGIAIVGVVIATRHRGSGSKEASASAQSDPGQSPDRGPNQRGLAADKPAVDRPPPAPPPAAVAAAFPVDAAPPPPPGTLLDAEHAALRSRDLHAVAELVLPPGFGFGIDAGDAGSDLEAQLDKLVPRGKLRVDATKQVIAQDRDVAWVAEHVVLRGDVTRALELTELLVLHDGGWRIAAWHWAVLVPNDLAMQAALAGTLPVPAALGDGANDPGLADAARTAFGSLDGLVAAFGEGEHVLSIGTAPGERISGAANVKRVFKRMKAKLRVQGLRAIAGGSWDPSQSYAGYSAANVDFVVARNEVEVTETFRVLCVWIHDPAGWRIVQAHWSLGGPVEAPPPPPAAQGAPDDDAAPTTPPAAPAPGEVGSGATDASE